MLINVPDEHGQKPTHDDLVARVQAAQKRYAAALREYADAARLRSDAETRVIKATQEYEDAQEDMMWSVACLEFEDSEDGLLLPRPPRG